MKNQMYITLLILPLLATGCGGRKETAQTMPIPEISVARPTVQNITLTKEYPGYLTSEKPDLRLPPSRCRAPAPQLHH